jgi:hypothetical protein
MRWSCLNDRKREGLILNFLAKNSPASSDPVGYTAFIGAYCDDENASSFTYSVNKYVDNITDPVVQARQRAAIDRGVEAGKKARQVNGAKSRERAARRASLWREQSRSAAGADAYDSTRGFQGASASSASRPRQPIPQQSIPWDSLRAPFAWEEAAVALRAPKYQPPQPQYERSAQVGSVGGVYPSPPGFERPSRSSMSGSRQPSGYSRQQAAANFGSLYSGGGGIQNSYVPTYDSSQRSPYVYADSKNPSSLSSSGRARK